MKKDAAATVTEAARYDDQRRAIIAVAQRLLAEEGPAALTTRRIADESSVTTMTIYSRFGGKEGLVAAVFAAGFDGLAEHLATVRATKSATRDLVRVCGAYRAFALEHPALYALMFERVIAEFRPSPESATDASRTFEVLVRATARVMGTDVTDAAARAGAYSLWALCHGLVNLQLSGMGAQKRPQDYDFAFDNAIRAQVGGLIGEAREDAALMP